MPQTRRVNVEKKPPDRRFFHAAGKLHGRFAIRRVFWERAAAHSSTRQGASAMSSVPKFFVFLFSGLLSLVAAATANAQVQTRSPDKPPVTMARSEHAWSGGGRSSTFDVHWQNGELKMIREEFAPSAGFIEKNEFVFNAGALLHFKQDRYPVPGGSGDAVALMVSFDKAGNPLVSMKRVGGKPVGAASPPDIAQARKHLGELQAIAMKAKP